MLSLIERIRTGLERPAHPKIFGDGDIAPGPEAHAHGAAPVAKLVPAAVLMPIIDARSPRLLLTTRTPHLRSHAGQVAFPGGRIDAGDDGAVADDGDGLQPLVALYRVEALREAVAAAIAAGDFSVQAMQQRMALARVRFAGLHFGNLNTSADLRLAGYADD